MLQTYVWYITCMSRQNPKAFRFIYHVGFSILRQTSTWRLLFLSIYTLNKMIFFSFNLCFTKMRSMLHHSFCLTIQVREVSWLPWWWRGREKSKLHWHGDESCSVFTNLFIPCNGMVLLSLEFTIIICSVFGF